VLDHEGTHRTPNPETRASHIAREVMKPFRAKVAGWNDAWVRINVLKDRAERRLASSEIWRKQAADLAVAVGEGQEAFRALADALPANVAHAGPVTNVDLSIKRLLVNLDKLLSGRR